MPRQAYTLDPLVVAESGTNSNALTNIEFGAARGLTIQAPATLPETCTVQVSLDGTTFGDLVSGGDPVTVGANEVVVVDWTGWKALRIQAGSAAAGERTFLVVALREY